MSQAEIAKNNVAVWFELPASDFERAVKFYNRVFNIELRKETMGDMRMAVFPYAGEAVSGAVVSQAAYTPGKDGCVVYLNAGHDLDQPLSRVEAEGGTVVMPKTLIDQKVGYIALFLDSEGNRVGLHSMH